MRDSPQREGELQLLNNLGSEGEEPGDKQVGWGGRWSIDSKDKVSVVRCECRRTQMQHPLIPLHFNSVSLIRRIVRIVLQSQIKKKKDANV